jgi:AmmeMemoRadiSam system protein B
VSRKNRTHFAGTWYSGDRNTLIDTIENAVGRAGKRNAPPTALTAAVLPHAGLSFSARGIAPAFQPTVPSYSRVVILSPSHYHPQSPNTLWVEAFDRHETPLGDIDGDPSFSRELAERLGEEVQFADEVIEREHGTEMFLPFIKWHSPNARVSLVLVPPVDDETVLSRWSQQMSDLIDPKQEDTLLVMSSDFTHYGRRFGYTPFGIPPADHDNVREKVADDDLQVARTIADRDVDGLLRRMQRPITVCGRYPILLGLRILDAQLPVDAATTSVAASTGANTIEGAVVDYYSSQTIIASADRDFVCYASILFAPTGAIADPRNRGTVGPTRGGDR